MFLSASDQGQRFSTNCVHKELVQLSRIKFHLRSELSADTVNALSMTGSRLPIVDTASKKNDHSLHFVSRPEKVGHLFTTRGCSTPAHLLAGLLAPVSELLRAVDALPSVLGPTVPTDRRHAALNGAPLPCCNVWMTSAFLAHHEKAVHTRSHKVFLTLQGWTAQEMTHKKDVCRKSGSSLHKVRRWSTEGLRMYNVDKFKEFGIIL